MPFQTEPRPLSFIAGPSESRFTATPRSPSLSKRHGTTFDVANGSPQKPTLGKRKSSDRINAASPINEGNGSPTAPQRMSSLSRDEISNTSPALSRNNSTDTAVHSFPLNDIDYESSPAAVAQELSNLQAIRRMSMNVDTADPDLPSFAPAGTVPALAPGHATSEDDPSKLFWVPARLHPELAPKEFKTFVEERVDKIRRRSGSEDSLSPESSERSPTSDGLRRKKSMLSHQIDPKGSYEDGAERLERRRSKGVQVSGQTTIANLHDLEELVNDPSQLVRRMSLDTQRRSEDAEDSSNEDMPILPPVQAALKRSTHTTYRRGSLRRGERVPFSKRALNRQADADQTEASQDIHDVPTQGISRVRTEPIPDSTNEKQFGARTSSMKAKHQIHTSPSLDDISQGKTSFDYDRELQPANDLQNFTIPQQDHVHDQPEHYDPRTQQQYQQQYQQQQPQYKNEHHYYPENPRQQRDQRPATQSEPVQPRKFQSRIASAGRTTAQLPGYNNTDPLPNIIETLPDGTKVPTGPLAAQAQQQFPERKSSFDVQRSMQRGGSRSKHPGERQQAGPATTLNELSSNPTLLPGSGTVTRTDDLMMLPTFEDRKVEKKDPGRKSSWKWILGNDDDDKKAKDMKRSGSNASEDAASMRSGKSSKLSKAEKARLDVLQTSLDNVEARPRESLVLNREDIKFDDGGRGKKSSDVQRKDKDSKDSGLLSAIFGGKKKSSDADVKEKKRKNDRVLDPEPTPRILKPDIDYNWTRFSILEERAIYRMAHIKLANPRRALYSQVLLSNFMYSYLAKVQMMHPQMQIPAAQQQKMQQEQQRQQKAKEAKEAAEYRDYQQYQEQASSQQPVHATGIATSTYDSSAVQAPNPYDQSEYHHQSGDHQGYDHADYSNSSAVQAAEQHPEWPDYRASTQSSHRQDAYTVNGGNQAHTYGVASTNDYMGYDKGHQQHYEREQLWEDEEREDLW